MRLENRILAVDDNPDNLLILEESLGSTFVVRCVESGQEALRVAPEFRPNVILLDLMMPGIDGHETCRLLRLLPEVRHAKILVLSARSDIQQRLAAYEAGAVDFIAKPFDPQEIRLKVDTWTRMIHRQQVETIWEDLEQTRNGIGLTLTSLVEFRDTETGDHLFRMRWYSQLLAEQIGMAGPYAEQVDEAFLKHLYRASPLHDLGKVAIDDAILRKPGRLTPEEFEVIKQHSVIGSDILTKAAADLPSADYLGMAIVIARHHHERFDGSGYPDGLAGQSIPLAARIVSVADVFDALTSDRVYRRAIRPAEAAVEIAAGSGSQFDPVLVEAFQARFDEIEQAWERFWERYQAELKAPTVIGRMFEGDGGRSLADHLEHITLHSGSTANSLSY